MYLVLYSHPVPAMVGSWQFPEIVQFTVDPQAAPVMEPVAVQAKLGSAPSEEGTEAVPLPVKLIVSVPPPAQADPASVRSPLIVMLMLRPPETRLTPPVPLNVPLMFICDSSTLLVAELSALAQLVRVPFIVKSRSTAET